MKEFKMKTVMNKTVLSLAAVSMLCITSVGMLATANAANNDQAWQSPHQMMNFKGHAKHFKRIARYLDLTDEQKAQAKQIHQQTKTAMEQNKPMMQAYHQELKTLKQGGNFNEQSFAQLRDKYKDVLDKVAFLRNNARVQFVQLLTDEQQQKLTKVREKMEQKREQRRANHNL